jgi:hypothetical protein
MAFKLTDISDFVVITPKRKVKGFDVAVGGIEFSADSPEEGKQWAIALLEQELAKLRKQ